jgi:predicted transcriptional regulator
MKTLSLKLDDIVFQETEQMREKIKKPRNRYINEALQYYNRIQKKKITAKLLEEESL